MDEVILRYRELPDRIDAMTVRDENADYNIYIDPRLSYDCQQDAISHEMQHIKRDDFANGGDINSCESAVRK